MQGVPGTLRVPRLSSRVDTSRFLNVDLDIRSRRSPSAFVQEMQRRAFVSHDERIGSVFRVGFELRRQVASVEGALRGFVKIIEGLSPSARAIWDAASERSLNVGVQAGEDAAQLVVRIAPRTLAAVARLEASLAFTVYGARRAR